MFDDLMAAVQEASWRGFTFSATDCRSRSSRKHAVHSYPFKDSTYVEDMGQGPTEIVVEGYLSGPDVYEMHRAFKDLCETQGGLGVLVHPYIGAVDAVLTGYGDSNRVNEFGIVSLNLTFLSGPVTDQPADASVLDTVGALSGLIGSAGDAVSSDFLKGVQDAYRKGVSLARGVSQTAQQVQRISGTIVRDAAGAVNAVKGIDTVLSGGTRVSRYNRTASGSMPQVLSTINTGLNTTARVQTAVSTMLASATRARTSVTAIGTTISSLGGIFR